MDARLDDFGDFVAWRDDLYTRGGSAGGKVRTCWALATAAPSRGLVTAGSRHSPQVSIVAGIAAHLGIPCSVHVPAGADTPEIAAAVRNKAEVTRHRPGYNTVIVARARDDAAARGWTLVPFGMECDEAVRQNAAAAALMSQATDRPRHIVVPVGSGMTLAGLLAGLPQGAGWSVTGVRVGADPTRRLARWAPMFGDHVPFRIVQHPTPYSRPANAALPDGTPLDAHYEAKAFDFVNQDDLLWVVGLRSTATQTQTERN